MKDVCGIRTVGCMTTLFPDRYTKNTKMRVPSLSYSEGITQIMVEIEIYRPLKKNPQENIAA